MVTKYQNFITEKKLFESFELLLETYLSSSSDFLNKLREISKSKGISGEIAKIIVEFIVGENWIEGENVKQNYFDVTDKDNMVSFIMQSKLSEISADDWDEEIDPSLPYNMRGRGEISVGRLVRYILTLIDKTNGLSIKPKDKDIEEFVNLYKSTSVDTNFKFELVKGSDISKYYNQKNYFSMQGSLGGSCMSDETKKIFKIYTENESKVSLLIYRDEKTDKISGRALVWKLKDSPCSAKYFMDRVYSNHDSDFFRFRQYAEENGFLYKQKMNSYFEDNVSFRYKGGDVFGEIRVKLDGDFKNYPFVDTLCFLSKDKKYLSNLPTEDCEILHTVFGDSSKCEDCEGEVFLDRRKTRICDECSVGHKKLKRLGVRTDINKNI
jgi:hypothetical protein